MEKIFSIALKLLALGYSLIPSGGGSEGKAPIVKWQDHQKKRPSKGQLKEWADKLKPKLWGIVTGEKSGIVVVDIDSAEAMKMMEAAGLRPHIRTPRGGAHYYFKHPGRKIKTCAGILPGVDIRGDGGFVNAIGTNPVTGGRYLIEIFPTLDSIYTWDQLPDQIRAKIDNEDSEPALDMVQDGLIPVGKRNSTITSIGGVFRYAGFDEIATYPILLDINEKICKEPLPEEEIRRIAKSLNRYKPGQQTGRKGPTIASQIVELAKDMELFHSPDGTSYATIEREGHSETWPLESTAIEEYLSRLYFKRFDKAPNKQAIKDALNVLIGKAKWDGDEKPVYIRIAGYQGNIYLDLCNVDWSVVEITNKGWEVTQSPPVRFVRSPGMAALPTPILDKGGEKWML